MGLTMATAGSVVTDDCRGTLDGVLRGSGLTMAAGRLEGFVGAVEDQGTFGGLHWSRQWPGEDGQAFVGPMMAGGQWAGFCRADDGRGKLGGLL